MTLYKITFDTSSYPFYVVAHDQNEALQRAIKALKDYGSCVSKQACIENLASGCQLVLDALDEKEKDQ